jgi:hypothetical protein
MALWRDPLDELIADLERALPPTSTSSGLDYARQLIEMQFMLAEIMKGPRLPLKPHPCDNETQQNIDTDPVAIPDSPTSTLADE